MAENIEPDQPENRWLACHIRHRLQGPAGGFELAVDLTIPRGEFTLLTGPSGAGKTTLLRILAGFQRPDTGHVRLGGRVWSDTASRTMLPVQRRQIGFVFQDYALFPNMSVRGNLDYALGRGATRDAAMHLLDMVGLTALAAAAPSQLSGGQKQRLALIRALARKPELLLLDEPLSALDPDLRLRMQDEVLRLHRHFATTTVMISHDPLEIARLADRVLRLENGRIVRDQPQETTGEPLALHVAGPDAEGWCTALIGERQHRLRYAVPPGGLPPGTPLRLTATPAGQKG